MNIAAAILLVAATAQAQERCGAAQDLVVRAIERLTPGGPNSEVEDALQLVKHATELCAGLGDAWYFRSVFERKLGRANLADYARRKAQAIGSEALNQKADPFHVAAPPGPPTRVVKDKWALVIGVSKFRSRFVPPLRFTAKDARDFAAVLTDPQVGRFPADHVKVLTDAEATTVRIRQELNWLARSAGPDDMAVIFLSSHGSSREMDTAGANYVVTHDTDVQDPDHLYATALPMVEVAEAVRTRTQARRTAVFLDTCHSAGAIANMHAASASGNMLAKFQAGAGRVIITSSQVSERSWESDKLGNGYFTHFLVEALRQGKGSVTLGEVYRFLRTNVVASVKADVQADQTPVLARSDEAAERIVLGAAPGAVTAWLGSVLPSLFPVR